MSVTDPSTWPQYATYDPEFDALNKALGGLPAPEDADVATIRTAFAQAGAQVAAMKGPPDYTGVKKSTIQIPTSDGSSISSLLYQPENASKGGPLVLLYHAGGFIAGAPEMEEDLALEVVHKHGGVALSVDYRLAPEHVFPVAITDSFDALKWAASNAASLGADPKKGLIVGGSSAGGNISAVLALMARDEKLSPPVTGVWLNIPAVVDNSQVPAKYRDIHTSYKQNANSPMLTVKAIDMLMKSYAPVATDPRFSPLLWPTGHKDLPPHLIQGAGLDPLRDDALIYAMELREQGVPVDVTIYTGVPHGFDISFPQLGMTQKSVGDRFQWFAKQFQK